VADTVEDFYDAIAADYDRIFEDWDAAVARQATSLAPLLTALGVEPGAPVLDCTCGIGTQAIGLALHGFDVTGSDVSRAAVERAGREAARLGAVARFRVADVRDLMSCLPGGFAAVVSFDNSLSHLASDEDLQSAARAMTSRLRAGGVIAASIRDYGRLAAERTPSTYPRVSGEHPHRSVSFQVWEWDADGGMYDAELLLLREGPAGWSTTSARTRLRALGRRQLGAALEGAGLVDVRWREPAETGYYQPIVSARQSAVV